MDISGLSKAKVLVALWNASQSQGNSFLDPRFMTPLTEEDAEKILATGQTYFDYLNGRVMKIDLSKDEVETWLFNRDNGDGSAERAISQLR